MTRLLLALAASATLAGCNFFFDPDAVERPADSSLPPGCTDTCAGKACGSLVCDQACGAGSGCIETHTVIGGLTAGGAAVKVTGGHKVSGQLVPTGSAMSADSGHSVVGGELR